MGTCRFILTNLAAGATVLNGTGGAGWPMPRSEVSPFVVERSLNSERRSLWRSAAAYDPLGLGGFDRSVDLDLGNAVTINAAAVLGCSTPVGNIPYAEVGFYNAYPPTSQLAISLLQINGRDAGIDFSSLAFTKRYWYLRVDGSGTSAAEAPTVGRLVLGQVYDLGMAPNPGSESTPFRNRLEQGQQDGSIHVHELGYPGHDFTLNFEPVTPAQADLVLALNSARGSVIYIDPDDRFFEVIIRGARIRNIRHYAGVRGVSLEMSRLP